MDPELYVFPTIQNPMVKVAASTALFILVVVAAGLLLPLLPGPHLWEAVERSLSPGSRAISLARLLHLGFGYGLFLYGAYHAWRSTRLKNTVEDSRHELATRILTTGYYAQVRHPMYAMFILANAGLGLAVCSAYGLAFSLLSLLLFTANGIYEERAVMLRFFGQAYQDYIRRVPARFFTPAINVLLVLALSANLAGLYLC